MITVVEDARMAVISMKALSLGLHEFHMWTDSMTALNWIINPVIRPTQFIRRKLDELRKKFEKVHHHYIPTKCYPQMSLPMV